MKKYKLKKGVKVALIIIMTISALVVFNKNTNDAIESCVKAGNSIEFCKSNLK